MNISDFVVKERERQGISAARLSRLADVAMGSVVRLEKADRVDKMQLDTIRRIVAALGLNAEITVSGAENPPETLSF